MTQDLNKNICGIEYNLLNLPTKVSFSDGSIITYGYSANGDKLSADYNLSLMNVMNGSTGSAQASSGVKLHRDYCGNFIYEDGALKKIMKKLMLLLFILCTAINIHGQTCQKELVRMKTKDPIFLFRLRKMLKAANLVWENGEKVSWCALYILNEDNFYRVVGEFRYDKDTLLRNDEFNGYMYLDSTLFLICDGQGHLTACKEYKTFTFYPPIKYEDPVTLFFKDTKTQMQNNSSTLRRQKYQKKKRYTRQKAKRKRLWM